MNELDSETLEKLPYWERWLYQALEEVEKEGIPSE
jgi:hypothetical protein